MSQEEALATLDFDRMNEPDVREIIVRPLLHRLGYRQGTEANIRTEVSLRYGKAFLGRKNPHKDPDLVGRADYICEVISLGRWAVEVKAPNVALDRESVEQAHTYAAHPEISAAFFLLTNGREFKLYQTGSLDEPVLAWDYAQLEEHVLPLLNVVGPSAVRKRANVMKVDRGKPLGLDLPSKVRIIGGTISYEEHASNTPLVPNEAINGLSLPVVGGSVQRTEDGMLHGHVKVAKVSPLFGDFGDALGVSDEYDFYAPDEYVSTDPAAPTIFQNLMEDTTPAGKLVMLPGFGQVPLPFGFTLKAFTEAVGYVEDGVFRGTMRLDYDLSVEGLTQQLRAGLRQMLGADVPDRSQFSGVGRFEVQLGDM